MLNLRDKVIWGVLVLFLIAALCAGVVHLVNNQHQLESGGHYHMALVIVTAEDAAASSGAVFGMHLNTGTQGSPLSACNRCVSTFRESIETFPPLSFLCKLLC